MTYRGRQRGRTFSIKTMLSDHDTIELEVIKELQGTEHYKCDEKRLSVLIQTRWRDSYILVTGVAGIGKTTLCARLAEKLLNKSQEVNVCIFENVDELLQNQYRHFNYSHQNHKRVHLVDNVTSSQLDKLKLAHTSNTTTIIFSRTHLVDSFDCVIEIKGLHIQKKPSLWNDDSSWSNHIKALCSVPFLLVLCERLVSKNISTHDIYFLLFSSYLNYCQTLQVSLFSCLHDVPERVEYCLKSMADIAYSCLNKSSQFIHEDQLLKKFPEVRQGDDIMGVIIKTNDGRWRFTFQGSAVCLVALKLYWNNEEQFGKDNNFVSRVPFEVIKLYEGVYLSI